MSPAPAPRRPVRPGHRQERRLPEDHVAGVCSQMYSPYGLQPAYVPERPTAWGLSATLAIYQRSWRFADRLAVSIVDPPSSFQWILWRFSKRRAVGVFVGLAPPRISAELCRFDGVFGPASRPQDGAGEG